VRVIESGGLSAAGRRLNLSKATVSDWVQALENALGVRLLKRITSTELIEAHDEAVSYHAGPARLDPERLRKPGSDVP
jgi:DNA-binding transcriptional LysR family regulator